MKYLKLALFGILMMAGLSTANGQDSTGTAKVYFVRHTGYNGIALAFHCFIDSSRVCDLMNNHYSVHTVPAGTHTINVTAYAKELKNASETKNTLTLDAKAGESYYIRIMPPKSNSFERSLKTLSVFEASIKPTIAKCKEDTNCLK